VTHMSDKAGVYVPPSVRSRRGVPKSTTDRVCKRFEDNGWRRPSGGSDLYLNPWGTSEHPHFHMRVDGYRITVQDDVRDAILFLSWSRGDQSEGGSAWKLYDRNAHIFDRTWEKGYNRVIGTRASTSGKDRLFAEIAEIMDYLRDNG
jgi:hypothetical protein